MPISIETRPELDLTIFTATGEAPFSEQMQILKAFYGSTPTGNVIWDFTRATNVAIRSDELRAIVQYTREHADLRPAGTTASLLIPHSSTGLPGWLPPLPNLKKRPGA